MIALKVETRQSGVYISEAARTRVFAGEEPLSVERTLFQTEDYVQQVLAFWLGEGPPVRVEKLIALSSSRDGATSDTLTKAGRAAVRHPNFAEALARHTGAWSELWRVCDMRVRADQEVQRLLRLHASTSSRSARAHRRSRRRRTCARAQRRGLPGARVLG